MLKRDLIPIFRVLSTHGLQGDLKVALLSSNEDFLQNLKEVYLLEPEEKTFPIKNLRRAPGFNIFILSLEGVNYNEAQGLINRDLYIKLEDLPTPEEEEIYYYQLEGLEVREKSGKIWGYVKEVMPSGDYELLLVRTPDKKDFYLPLVPEYVEEIVLEEKVIFVKDIKDLVEVQF